MPNNCIVRFKDDVPRADVPGQARGLLARGNAVNNASAKLKNIYQHSIKGFTLSMPCHAASRAFGDDPMVQALEVDSIVFMNPRPPGKGPGGGGGGDDTSPDPQVTPWGIARVGGPQDGTGYTAWVLDTGIDVDHPDLNVAASRGFSAFNKGKDSGVDDGQGHGTHVAGTIAALNNNRDVVGVAAGASLVPVKVLDRRGSGSTSGVIAGVDFVGANASPGDCANMSLGGGISSSWMQPSVMLPLIQGLFSRWLRVMKVKTRTTALLRVLTAITYLRSQRMIRRIGLQAFPTTVIHPLTMPHQVSVFYRPRRAVVR